MIPEKVIVAGVEYEVTEVDQLVEKYELGGQVLYHKANIDLDKSLPPTKKEQIFVHELLHACFFEAGYQDHEEEMINRVGIVLYQVLKDNKLYFGKE